MKAAYIEHTGSAANIKFGELPIPDITEKEVLVKVQAAAVDPIDTYIRSGQYKIDLPFPFVIGRDMVGRVSRVGSKVTDFKPGDMVWCNNQGYSGRQGTFAEFISVHENFLYHSPKGADPLALVACAHSALTAITGLQYKAQLKEGERIFINGGSGNVGQCGIQLAKSLGAIVAVTAGSEEKSQRCKTDGADNVINYKNEDVVAAVKRFAPAGVDVYWDLTGNPDVQQAIDLGARRCRIVLSSGLTHQTSFLVGSFYTRNCTLYGFTITDLDVKELRHFSLMTNVKLLDGTFRPHIEKILPLADAAKAHELVESGRIAGKVIVSMPDTEDKPD
jgi:NADPH2:quinone reductase